ncbi:MAG TPA: hypothetical protein VG709_04670, partial [Actinomycetota bacterium]|nr:hypothetical protein [Actinomycetota bacterium]
MLALRVLAEVLAAALLGWAIWRYRDRRITRLNLIVSGVLAIGLALLAGVPALFDPLFDAFQFERGGGMRLIAVLVVGNLILLLLVVSNRGQTDVVRRDLKSLLEWLGAESFDEAQAETLPAGDRIVVVMPAHNEADNIEGVVRAMPEKIDGHVVVPLVVDDASED